MWYNIRGKFEKYAKSCNLLNKIQLHILGTWGKNENKIKIIK